GSSPSGSFPGGTFRSTFSPATTNSTPLDMKIAVNGSTSFADTGFPSSSTETSSQVPWTSSRSPFFLPPASPFLSPAPEANGATTSSATTSTSDRLHIANLLSRRGRSVLDAQVLGRDHAEDLLDGGLALGHLEQGGLTELDGPLLDRLGADHLQRLLGHHQ